MSGGYPVVNQGLDPGDNQPLSLKETSAPGSYVTAVGATSTQDIILGSPGGAGNKLYAIVVLNGSGSPFSAFSIKDGTTTLSVLDTSSFTTLASGSRATFIPPGGVLESKNGAWRINITCAGTMANISILAVIAEGT